MSEPGSNMHAAVSPRNSSRRSLKEVVQRRLFHHRVFRVLRFELAVTPEATRDLQETQLVIREGVRDDLDRMKSIERWDDVDVYRKWLEQGEKFLAANRDARSLPTPG
jgi:hypothetical protein